MRERAESDGGGGGLCVDTERELQDGWRGRNGLVIGCCGQPEINPLTSQRSVIAAIAIQSTPFYPRSLAAWGRKPGPGDARVLKFLSAGSRFLQRASRLLEGGHWRCGDERKGQDRETRRNGQKVHFQAINILSPIIVHA